MLKIEPNNMLPYANKPNLPTPAKKIYEPTIFSTLRQSKSKGKHGLSSKRFSVPNSARMDKDESITSDTIELKN